MRDYSNLQFIDEEKTVRKLKAWLNHCTKNLQRYLMAAQMKHAGLPFTKIAEVLEVGKARAGMIVWMVTRKIQRIKDRERKE